MNLPREITLVIKSALGISLDIKRATETKSIKASQVIISEIAIVYYITHDCYDLLWCWNLVLLLESYVVLYVFTKLYILLALPATSFVSPWIMFLIILWHIFLLCFNFYYPMNEYYYHRLFIYLMELNLIVTITLYSRCGRLTVCEAYIYRIMDAKFLGIM